METLKDIFVSYEIAQKLKEIGFDEPCIGYYEKDNPNVRLNEKTGTIKHNSLLIYISAPTWEQVFKWFREKGFYGNIQTGLLSTAIKITVAPEFENEEYFREVYDNENHYEEAREQLILKLIEIYKDGKKDR